MEESLNVFNDISGNRWFRKSDIILFLNKTDLLEQKLLQGSKFSQSFPDYTGGENYDEVSKYIRSQYEERARGRELYTHFTCATDDTPSLKQLFQSVKTIIVEKNVRAGGLLI